MTVIASASADVRLGVGAGAVWESSGRLVRRIDPSSNRVHALRLKGTGGELTFAGGHVYVAVPSAATVEEIDPASFRVTRSFRFPLDPDDPWIALATGSDSLWVGLFGRGELYRVDLVSGDSTLEYDGWDCSHMVAVRGVLWGDCGELLRFAPGFIVTTFPGRSGSVATGGGRLWLAKSDEVQALDPQTGSIRGRLRLPKSILGYLVAARGHAWVRDLNRDRVYEIAA